MAIEATALALSVATPLGMELSLEVETVQLPVVTGEIGVLPGHVPLLGALKPGVLRYRAKGQNGVAAIGAGFVEASATRVRVIAEYFAKPEDIETSEAQRDLEVATQKLKDSTVPLGEPAQVEAQKELDWALARLEVAGGPAATQH
ncbi:MAG TPA: ATP synthase F1 subunit epsilon [Polyangiales bacterium]|nr:ATP synthase F1 subunit epsilon [Polyangiales bacterium]